MINGELKIRSLVSEVDTRATSDAMEGLTPPFVTRNMKTVNTRGSVVNERDLLIKSEFLGEFLGTFYRGWDKWNDRTKGDGCE